MVILEGEGDGSIFFCVSLCFISDSEIKIEPSPLIIALEMLPHGTGLLTYNEWCAIAFFSDQKRQRRKDLSCKTKIL